MCRYTGGIFDGPSCELPIDHAMLIVGYGSENGTDFWMVKWAPDTPLHAESVFLFDCAPYRLIVEVLEELLLRPVYGRLSYAATSISL